MTFSFLCLLFVLWIKYLKAKAHQQESRDVLLIYLNIFSCQIHVDGEQRQKVRSASRTKALLHNLALDTAMEISVTSTNKVSTAAVLRTNSH